MHHAAARAEGQAFEMVVPARILRHPIHRFGRGRDAAHRHAADLRRRGHIAFEQRRRKRQSAGDIVESARGIVGGKILRRIDLRAPAGRGSRSRIRCDSGDADPAEAGARPHSCPAPSRVNRDGFEVAASGRGTPEGGIIPARNLRTMVSAASGCSLACDKSRPSSVRSRAELRPAALARWLWQAAQ